MTEYEDQYEELRESWNTIVYQDAKKRRDYRARELRSQGWTVQIETIHDDDGNINYSVFGERRKKK